MNQVVLSTTQLTTNAREKLQVLLDAAATGHIAVDLFGAGNNANSAVNAFLFEGLDLLVEKHLPRSHQMQHPEVIDGPHSIVSQILAEVGYTLRSISSEGLLEPLS